MRRYFTPRAVGMHVTLVVLLPTFAGLTWWQLHRAISGNTLSWAYTFEWPLFGGYAVYLWWHLVRDQAAAPAGGSRDDAVPAADGPDAHDQPGWALGRPSRRREAGPGARPGGATAPSAAAAGGPPTGSDDEPDDELAAYNRYLAELHAGPARRRW